MDTPEITPHTDMCNILVPPAAISLLNLKAIPGMHNNNGARGHKSVIICTASPDNKH